ncbi:MAG: tRNA 2-selenouridine(34) synthase MnmH [Synechococcales cyanobacterium RM1_1_8]|nr:tRNA 2-selenouridine(34) synthase MnmH [Synechococcales cyanobacterium RM1_1_8]
MPEILAIQPFLDGSGPVLDARSPGEFAKAHLPGAVNLPLFSDAERAAVGTCYHQVGREQAVELGLGFVGPKLLALVQRAKQIAPERRLRLHCWRGGMRSSSLAWLLETAGFRVELLAGGYKAYRRWVREVLAQPRPIWMVGGMTGTGKTLVLEALASLGEQMLDLEGLANHRGSSYGNVCLPPQPSTEQYENLLAERWAGFDPGRRVWIEAESRQVGRCRIAPELFGQMERSPILEIQRSRAERIALLESVYGEADPEELIEATRRIGRRLGPQNTQAAVEAIRQGDLAPAIERVLDYYDKSYRYDLERRTVPRHARQVTGLTPLAAAADLLDQARKLEVVAEDGETQAEQDQ